MRLIHLFSQRGSAARCFEQELLELSQKPYSTDLGIVEVPTGSIVGLAVRCQEPRSHGGLQRAQLRLPRVKRRARVVESVVRLFRFGDAYFVDSGHETLHRAKRRGIESVRAQVVAYVVPTSDIGGLLARARAEFARETGIADIELPSPQGYAGVAAQIKAHHGFLERTQERLLSPEGALADWQHTIHGPIVEGLEAEIEAALPPGWGPEEGFERIRYFLGRLATLSDLPLSQALLDLIADPSPWEAKARAVLPPCLYTGRCPY